MHDLPIDEWRNSLDSLNNDVRSLVTGTESEFLSIISALQKFSLDGNELYGMSQSASDLTSSGTIEDAIEGLHEQVSILSGHLDACEQRMSGSIDALRTVGGIIDSICGTSRGFKRIVRTLRVLAISTRIESSRLGAGAGGFNTLANDTEKLAGQIEIKHAKILERANELNDAIDAILSNTTCALRDQRKAAGDIIDKTRAGVKDLILMNRNSCEISDDIIDRSNNLRGEIDKIVVATQFHDITRQQMEHVGMALTDAIDRLDRFSGDAGNDENDDEAVELAAWIADLCELEASQTRNTREHLNGAVLGIKRNLSDMAEDVAIIAMQTREIVGASDESGSTDNSLIARIKGEIENVLDLLQRNTVRKRQMSESMSSAADTVTHMSTFIGDIEDIGDEMKLIAMNARVKAAHTGREGEALGVLAESIQKLSDEARNQSLLVSEPLAAIAGESERLRRITGDGDNQEWADEITNNLESIVQSMSGMEKRLFELFDRINAFGMNTSAEANRVAARITVHETMSAAADRIIAELEKISSEARQFAPDFNKSGREARLRELTQRYTMQSERLVHSTPSGGLGTAKGKSGSVDIGDNVELF
ncbi:MAG: hypothetical protein HZA20_09825 [Nitrospirae bacterium]|nr:hypothetical protein [Nitrospirota bacterium]